MIQSVKLCPCNSTGCPSVQLEDGGKIRIKDDFGGEVVMTLEEALLIQNALDQLFGDYP